MPYKTLECEHCGSEFEGWHSAKWCSDECKRKDVFVQAICKNCKEAFQYNPRTTSNGNQQYCSHECKDEFRPKLECQYCGAAFRGWHNQKFCSDKCSRLSRSVQCKCKYCGEKYIVKESSAGDSNYCSPECQHAASRNRISLTCQECGSEYERKKCEADGSNYCSRKCADLARRKPGNVSYYGGNWYQMRRVVRSRDCFRCRRCGVHEDECNTELHVHHIVPIREFDEPEEANTPNNLVTVCPSCHGKVEGDVEAGRNLL